MEVKIKTPYQKIVTIDEAKNHVNYDDNHTDTLNALHNMIEAAQGLCENYTETYFSKRDVVFYFEKDCDYDEDEKTLIFPFSPVNTLSEVLAIDKEGNETELEDGSTYYLRGLKRKKIYIPTSISTGTYVEIIAWKVTANIGSDTVDPVAKQAVLKLVAEWYKNKFNYIPILNDQVKDMLSNITDKGWL
jgi:uncharacterized phiE125 gp8 family phage protein